MQQVWDNDEELTNELEALRKRVDNVVRSHEGMDQKAVKDETKGCQEQIREIAALLKRQKRDIEFHCKQNGALNEKQKEELMGQYYQPVATQHEQLKEKIAGLQGLGSSKPEKVERAKEELSRADPPPERDEEQEMQEIIQTTTVAEVQDRAISIQEDGTKAAKRSERILEEMQGVAGHIETRLAADNEQIEHIIDDMDNLNAQVKRARREVGAFSRRMATDKCFTCLFILVLLFVCTVIGLRIFNKSNDSKSSNEDPRLQQFEGDARLIHSMARRVVG